MRGLFIFNLKQRWRLVLRKIVESIIDTNRGVIKHLISMPRVLLSFFIVKYVRYFLVGYGRRSDVVVVWRFLVPLNEKTVVNE